jgi:hypothetical protein
MTKFDPVMKEHVRHFVNNENSRYYFSHRVQNDFIQKLSEEVTSSVVWEVQKMKYFSIILDFTPDISHQEQMSVNVQIVSTHEEVMIKEHFLRFISAESTTGNVLSERVLQLLQEYDIPFENCRGQGCDK